MGRRRGFDLALERGFLGEYNVRLFGFRGFLEAGFRRGLYVDLRGFFGAGFRRGLYVDLRGFLGARRGFRRAGFLRAGFRRAGFLRVGFRRAGPPQ